MHLEPAFEYAEPLVYTLTIDGKTTKKRGKKRDQFAAELLHFSDCVLNDRAPEPSAEEGAQDVRIVEALYESAGRGERSPSRRLRPTAPPGVRKRWICLRSGSLCSSTPRRHTISARRSRAQAPFDAVDLNAVAAGLLRDLASIQTSPHKERGYRGAAGAVMRLDDPLVMLRQADGTIRKIAAIGPSSARIIAEVLETGGSATVEAAIAASGRAVDVARRRGLRTIS